MGKYSRLGENTLLVFIGNTGAKLIGLLMLPFYTRWLSVEDYGTIDVLNVYITLILCLISASIAEAIFIFPKGQTSEKQKIYFSSGLFFVFISLIVTAILFKIIVLFFAYREVSNRFITSIWYIYFLLATIFIQQYIQQFTRSIDKIRVYSTTGIVLTLSTAIFSFLIIPKWGVFGYIFSLIFSNLLAAIYSFVFSGARKYLSIVSIQKKSCKEMLGYSIPLIPNSIMVWLINAINRPIMEKYLGLHSIGIFAVANKFPGIISVASSIFLTSWQISVLEEFGKDGYTSFYNKIFRLITMSFFFLFFIIAFCSKLIIKLFASSQYFEAWKYMPLLTLSVILSSISAFCGSNFSAARKSKYYFYSSVCGAITSIISNFILIPILNIYGAVIATSLCYMAMLVLRVYYGWKYVKIDGIIFYLFVLIISIAFIIVNLCVGKMFVRIMIEIALFVLFLILNFYSIKQAIIMLKKYLLKKIGNEI
jgi:O-antigen/teichoic acid export membrane protein